MTKQGKSANFQAVMMALNLLLFLFFAWMLYDRLSMHFGVSPVEIIPQARPVAITRPVMPKPTTLPSALEVPKEATKGTTATKATKGTTATKATKETTATKATKETKETKETTAKPEKPAKPSGPKKKTQRIDFEYSNPEAKSVSIDGSFLNWKPKPMKRNGNSWRINLYIFPGKYRYHFVVDGKKTLDPLQPLKRKGESYLIVVP